MSDREGESEEARLPHEALQALPLGYQAIWERGLMSRESLRALTVRNTRWWSSGVARSSAKPISKIVWLPQDQGDHGSDSAPR